MTVSGVLRCPAVFRPTAEYATGPTCSTGALNRQVESARRPPALSHRLHRTSARMKAKTQCSILPRIIEGIILQNKNHSAKHNSILFTEFTEATNEYTDGISRHRLPPYSAYYH